MSKKERHTIEDLKHEVMAGLDQSTNESRITARNKAIDAVFLYLENKYPNWRIEPLYEETAKYFPPLSARTIQYIISGGFDRKREARKQQYSNPNQMSIFGDDDARQQPNANN